MSDLAALLLSDIPPEQHGQLCPVWTHRADAAKKKPRNPPPVCDCWQTLWSDRLAARLAAANVVVLTPPPDALREAAQALVTATDTLDDWDLRHRYVVNSERDALAGDLSSAWFNLRAALAQPKEADRE